MDNLSLSGEEEFDYEDYDLDNDDEEKLLKDDSSDNDRKTNSHNNEAGDAVADNNDDDDGEVLRIDIGEDLKLIESPSEHSKKDNESCKTTQSDRHEKYHRSKEYKDKYGDVKRIRRISPVRSNRNSRRYRFRHNDRRKVPNYTRWGGRSNDGVNAVLNFEAPPKYDDNTNRSNRSNNIELHPQDTIRPDVLVNEVITNGQRQLLEIDQQPNYFIQQQQQQQQSQHLQTIPSLFEIKTSIPPCYNQHNESFNSSNSFNQPRSLSPENLFRQPPPFQLTLSPSLLVSTSSQQQYQEEPQFYQQQQPQKYYYQEELQYYQQQPHQQEYRYQEANCENGGIFGRLSRNETLKTTTQQNKGKITDRLGNIKRISRENSNFSFRHSLNDKTARTPTPPPPPSLSPPKEIALFVDEEYKRGMEEQKRERERIFKLKEERRLKALAEEKQKLLQQKNTNNDSNNIESNQDKLSTKILNTTTQLRTDNNTKSNQDKLPTKILNITTQLRTDNNVKSNQDKLSTNILNPTTQLRTDNNNIKPTKMDNVMPKKFTIKNDLFKDNVETVKKSNNTNINVFMSDRLVVKKKESLTNKPNIAKTKSVSPFKSATANTATSTITTTITKKPILSLNYDNNKNIINVDNNRNNNDNISSFLNNRKIIAKDQQSRIPLINISNLSVHTTKSRLLELAQAVGEVQKIHHEPKERCATILFKDIAAAQLFYEQYQQYSLDLSVIDIRLVPRM